MVAVKEDENIMLNDGSVPTRTLMPRWLKNNYEDFYIACLNLNKSNKDVTGYYITLVHRATTP
jgi:hypothetical protein